MERRLGALVRIPWDLVKKDGLNDAEDCLADAQLRTLIDFANALENLDEAIPALAQASFRHFRRIQLLETEYGNLRLNITNNWNWCRDGYQGEWMWNPAATFGVSRGEPLPVAPESIVTRLCPRPIDQPAMMLCLDRKNAKAQWLVFNGRYGTPPLFAILPDGVDEKTRADYIDFARQCVSNACGVLPNGSDVKAVSVGSTGPDTFRGMLDLSTQELVLRATGGLMTMLTAPGAGTNTDTGSAHQDAFNDLAEREAAEIAAVLDAALFAPILDQWHPGQPHLVEFVMRRPDSDNASGAVANITALAGAGYRPSAEQVSELTGLEVEDTGAPGADPSQGAGTGAAAAMLNSTRRRWLPLMKYAPARDAFERSLNSKQQRLCALNAAIAPQDPADSPLSDKELAALKNLGGVSLADFIHADADTLSDGMLAAVASIRSRATNAEDEENPNDITDWLEELEDDAEDEKVETATNATRPCRSKHPEKCPYHGGLYHHSVGKRGNAAKLGLPSLKEMKGDAATHRIKQREAEAKLKGTIKVKTVDGSEIIFDDDVTKHWRGEDGSKPKSNKEREWRASHLLDALRAARYPHEIWQGAGGRKIYVRKYKNPQGGYVMAGIVQHNGKARTYYLDQKTEKMEKVRQGKLLYCRSKK